MSRLLLAVLVGAVLVTAGGYAHADDSLPNGAVITWNKFFINEGGGDLSQPTDPTARRNYLNLAHCQCAQTGAGDETDFEYEVGLSTSTGTHRPGEVWVGTQCDNDTLRGTSCRHIADQDIADIDTLAVTTTRVHLSLYDVINGAMNEDACESAEGDRYIWILVDVGGDATYDYFAKQVLGGDTATTDIGVDTTPPPPVVTPVASAGEGQIKLSWTLPTSRATDLYAFQALCSLNGAAIKPDKFEPLYSTTTALCDRAEEFEFGTANVTSSDAGTPITEVPPEFTSLDQTFLCGEEVSGTSTSLTIDGLKNDVEYTVALLVVDLYGNVNATYFTAKVAPRSVTDLWEDIHSRDGGIEGGCLSVAGSGGSCGGLVMAIGVAIVLARRGKKRGAGAAMTLAVLLALPHRAHADTYDPYWTADNVNGDDSGGLLDDTGIVKWHVGLRVGPYIPGIDSQVGKNATTGLGPYEAMFGDYTVTGDTKVHSAHVWQVLPMLDVDRVVWRRFGQITVGGSIGYMQKTALAYAQGSSENDLVRPRQSGNETVFRLLPVELAVGYRFTYLHDMYRVPIVPYVRGGLGYYMWLMRAPNGDLSRVCEDGMAGCESDKNANSAKGASIGVVGAIGIAIRAEDIDRDSARSMRETGVQHAGVYAELNLAKVDGFGSDTKLSVGDTTWFAGIDFEF